MADIDERSFVAKLWLIASVADAVPLSRIGEMRCCDSRLRQWAVCVTLPASPKTVTHAWRNTAFGAALYVYVKKWLPQGTTAGQRIGK